MEKGGGGGGDPAMAVGMCDRFMTFLVKNLSVNRPKNITDGARNGSNNHGDHAEKGVVQDGEDDDDEFAIKIEKAEFELIHEEEEGGHKSITATILEEKNTDVSSTRGIVQKEDEAAGHQVAADAAVPVPVPEKKVKKTVTIKEEQAGGGEKDAPAAKKTLFKKRQASSSQLGGKRQASSSQLGGGEDQKPQPRRGLRPRMPAILRVPSNINERSSNFIEERKRSFGAGGKLEK